MYKFEINIKQIWGDLNEVLDKRRKKKKSLICSEINLQILKNKIFPSQSGHDMSITETHISKLSGNHNSI